MGGQEVVALLECGELLQRQWIHPAEFGEFTFGAFGATLLGGPVERHRHRRGHRLAALAGLGVLGQLQLRRWQQHLRAVLGEEIITGHAELLEHHLLELLDAQLGLGLGNLVAVQGFGQRADAGVELGDLRARCGHRGGTLQALRGELVPHPRGRSHDDHEVRGNAAAGLGNRGGNLRGVLTRGAGLLRAQTSIALRRRRSPKRISPSANGIRAFLGGAHRQPSLNLECAGLFRRGLHLTSFPRRRLDDGLALLGGTQSRLEFGEFGDCLHPAGLEFVALRLQPAPLLLGQPDLLAESAKLLIDRRHRGVGLVERCERLLGGVLAVGLLGNGARQRRGKLGDLGLGGEEFGPGLLDFAGDFQSAGLAAGAAVHPARTHQVAVAGHRAQPRTLRDQVQGGADVVDDGHPGQHGRHGALQSRRRLDEINGPAGTIGKRTEVLARWHRPVRQHNGSASAVNVLEGAHRRPGCTKVVGRHRVGRRAEYRGQCRFEAGADLHQRGDGSEKPCATAVFQEPRGAVPALESHCERIDPGL